MFLTSNKTADLGASSSAGAAQRARMASSAAAANASNAAQNAALAAQNAASMAQAAAQNAAALAARASQNASGAAQTAASGVSKGVRQGVYTARSWAAPRLDTAADYCTTTVAPRLSSALHSTARQVNPVDTTTSTKRSSMLTWSVLGAAILAAMGAAAAVLVRYRYRTAIAADTETAEDEVLMDPTGSQPAPVTPDGTRATSGTPTATTPRDPSRDPSQQDQGTETSVNGRVASSGW